MQKLSLITAAYNSGNTISDTIQSIRQQTIKNVEYVIVDGASKDNTLALIEKNSDVITDHISEPDRGIYDAYNKGLSMVSGEIIGFLNSDDFYSRNDVLEMVLEAFDDPSIEAVYADLVYVDQHDTSKVLRHWKSKDYEQGDFARAFVPAHPTLFLRRSVYERCGNFDLDFKLAADYEFMLRIFHSGGVKAKYIPEIIVKMRAGGATGESISAIKKQNVEIKLALEKYEVRYNKLAFITSKLFNRLGQRLRASKVQFPEQREIK